MEVVIYNVQSQQQKQQNCQRRTWVAIINDYSIELFLKQAAYLLICTLEPLSKIIAL